MQITADVGKTSKAVQRDLMFISDELSEFDVILVSNFIFSAVKMLLVSPYTLGESIEFMFNKSIVFFNSRDIVNFVESRYSQSAAIQNEGNREAVGKKQHHLKNSITNT